MNRLTPEMIERLRQPLDPSHVIAGEDGLSHLRHRYIRETLTDIFGPCGYDLTTLELTHLDRYRSRDEEHAQAPWWILYRAQVRLTVKAPNGDRLASYDGAAVGSAFAATTAQAHDWAMKAALSNALKHAAKDLGEQFGLTLYPDNNEQETITP